MGKNKRRQFLGKDTVHNVDLQMDSIEELDFLEWCIEAVSLGIISDFEYQPEPIKLFDKVDYIAWNGKKRLLFRDHIYSPDFKLTFDPRCNEVLQKTFKMNQSDTTKKSFQVHLDVKGTFQRNDGGRSFSINQKWVFQKTGICIVKIVPKDFFAVCGCPSSCMKTRKTGRERKAFSGLKSLEEVFKAEKSKKPT